ncbi:MAG: hypothetical protein IPK72_08940 [Candidatus Eisenbacteria bacterium]|nr:hypothetical protein [Candidatus Eisenbacteria bacterium]
MKRLSMTLQEQRVEVARLDATIVTNRGSLEVADDPGPNEAPPDQIVIYQDGGTRLRVRIEGKTVWLSQRLIAELFQISVPTVDDHLAGNHADHELAREATIRRIRIVRLEGHRSSSESNYGA